MLSLLFSAIIVATVTAGPTAPYRLRVEYMNNPEGVDVPYAPRLTWAIGHTARGQVQSAYRVAVSKLTGDGWAAHYDSGKTSGNATQNQHLQADLTPGTKYSWTVRYYDGTGEASPWAGNGTFSTGVKDWTSAQWIGGASPGCFQARKKFTTSVRKQIVRATIYAVGLGYYKLHVDGVKVSTHELGAFTTYTKRVYYDTYDATDAMRIAGGAEHVVGVSVGDG